ncbi:hypothetical protein ACQ4PT_068596 [Festuca glaucescens]
MADAHEEKAKEARMKREHSMRRLSMAEEFWRPNKEPRSRQVEQDPGHYFTRRLWDTDKITRVPPMCFTDTHVDYAYHRNSMQVVSIKIGSVRGGLRWPMEVFGMVTARDVMDMDRSRNIIFAGPRSICQTITEEHPYLQLTGPSRAIVTCIDLGNIEIALKVKGATESDDRDLSLLVLTLKGGGYCSFDKDYNSKCSTLKLDFRHVYNAMEATISVRLASGSSVPPGGLQGVFVASIDNAEILLLAFEDARLQVADDGTIRLSRRVVSIRYGKSDRLKVSILARCDGETGQVAMTDDIVFTPKLSGLEGWVQDLGGAFISVQ